MIAAYDHAGFHSSSILHHWHSADLIPFFSRFTPFPYGSEPIQCLLSWWEQFPSNPTVRPTYIAIHKSPIEQRIIKSQLIPGIEKPRPKLRPGPSLHLRLVLFRLTLGVVSARFEHRDRFASTECPLDDSTRENSHRNALAFSSLIQLRNHLA